MLLISKIPHFESNSQLVKVANSIGTSCYWYQRYLILKAIHNYNSLFLRSHNVVTDIKDTSFWKQFTTKGGKDRWYHLLLLISKIPHFESNSQHIVTYKELEDMLLLISKIPHFESNSQRRYHSYSSVFCCYWYQRYLILKAIHNSVSSSASFSRVVTDIKDTSFWKQFTTSPRRLTLDKLLLLISKIPHFESNSQLQRNPIAPSLCCYWYQRYLILKAIHNRLADDTKNKEVVTDIKDTSFWKQFTTRHCIHSQ